MNRGYPPIALMYELSHRNIHFCMRLKGNWWKEFEKMLANDETDKEFFFKLPTKDKAPKNKYKSSINGITARVVVIETGNGEKEALCTSLMGQGGIQHR